MEILFFPLIGLIYFAVFSFTGGFAGAIHGGGREDRSLMANAGIGLVGWAVAAIVWRFLTGDYADEFTLGLGLLALLSSIVFIHFLGKRRSRQKETSPQS